MKITQLQHVSYGAEPQINEDGELEAVLLTITDVRQLVPGTAPVPIETFIIPFDAESWVNFKRLVNADGKISPIAIAKTVPVA